MLRNPIKQAIRAVRPQAAAFAVGLWLFLGLAVAGPASAQEREPLDPFAALQAQDVRLAAIAERQLAANVALCERQMPLTGLVLHSSEQYSTPAVSNAFTNGPIAIAAIVAGSPAHAADIRIGDGLLSVNNIPTASLTAQGEAPLRDAAFDLIAAQPLDEPLVFGLQRDDQRLEVSLAPRPGCMALVEIVTGAGLMGRSDGRVIQVSYDLATLLNDDELAVIFAHELAHVVLNHRTRLVAAGVSKGLLGEFGRNQQLNRHVEVEADRMSPHILANAGFAAEIAPAFWRSARGRGAGGGLMRSFIYPSPVSRGDLIAREIEQYLPIGRGPTWPQHLLAQRRLPF